MKFEIERFYQQRGIDYIDKGVNVKKGEINISCPFCNSSANPDPSYHLGVAVNGKYWSCWRNKKHRGKSLHRLIMKLLRVSYNEASDIIGEKVTWMEEGAFDALDPENLFGHIEEVVEQKELTLPKEFTKFQHFRSGVPYENYLTQRKFHPDHLDRFLHQYDLRYCISGIWAGRILLPIHFNFELVTWTGRAIGRHASLRYRSLSEKETALISIKDVVFNFDELLNYKGKVLFITEGPFDAMKMDFYGQRVNCRATCLFSKALRPSQLILLAELADNFDKLVVLLDSSELDTELEVQSMFAFLSNKVELGVLPEGVDDPGELSQTGVLRVCHNYT